MENEYDLEKTKKYIMDRHNNFINFMSSNLNFYLLILDKLIEKDNFSIRNYEVSKPGIK